MNQLDAPFESIVIFLKYLLNAPFDCSQMLWMPDVVEIHCQRPVEMKCYPDTAVWSVCVIFCSLLGSFHLSAAIALSRVQVWLTCSSSQLDTRLQHFTLLRLLSLVNCIEKVAATSTLLAGRRQRVRGGWHRENCLQSSPSSPEVAPPLPPPSPSSSSSSPTTPPP